MFYTKLLQVPIKSLKSTNPEIRPNVIALISKTLYIPRLLYKFRPLPKFE